MESEIGKCRSWELRRAWVNRTSESQIKSLSTLSHGGRLHKWAWVWINLRTLELSLPTSTRLNNAPKLRARLDLSHVLYKQVSLVSSPADLREWTMYRLVSYRRSSKSILRCKILMASLSLAMSKTNAATILNSRSSSPSSTTKSSASAILASKALKSTSLQLKKRKSSPTWKRRSPSATGR